jgi:hypothetical protein
MRTNQRGGHVVQVFPRGDCAQALLRSIYADLQSKAEPGDQMDLVDAPNATAVTAIQDGLAPAHEYDTQLDANISSRAEPGDQMTLTAGERTSIGTAVWATTTRTLTSFGTLVADTAAAVWAVAVRTITGGTVDDVGGQDLSNLDATVSSRSSHAAPDLSNLDVAVSTRGTADAGDEMALTAAARNLVRDGLATGANVTAAVDTLGGADDRDLTEVYDAVAAIGEGTGAWPVTLTVEDDSGNPVAGMAVTVPTAGVQYSAAATGETQWNLDAATYTVIVRTNAAYTPAASYTVTVAADGSVTGGTLVVVAAALPEPAGLDNIVLYDKRLAVEEGIPITTTVRVVDIDRDAQVDVDGATIHALRRATYTTDSDGLWQVEIPRVLFEKEARLTLHFAWTDADGNARAETWVGNLTDPGEAVSQQAWSASTNLVRTEQS